MQEQHGDPWQQPGTNAGSAFLSLTYVFALWSSTSKSQDTANVASIAFSNSIDSAAPIDNTMATQNTSDTALATANGDFRSTSSKYKDKIEYEIWRRLYPTPPRILDLDFFTGALVGTSHSNHPLCDVATTFVYYSDGVEGLERLQDTTKHHAYRCIFNRSKHSASKSGGLAVYRSKSEVKVAIYTQHPVIWGFDCCDVSAHLLVKYIIGAGGSWKATSCRAFWGLADMTDDSTVEAVSHLVSKLFLVAIVDVKQSKRRR